MSSKFVDWNKMNDEDSSSQEEHSDHETSNINQESMPINKKTQSIGKNIEQHTQFTPLFPEKTSKYKNLIEENLAKIQANQSSDIWLFVHYNQKESYEEVKQILKGLPQVKKIFNVNQIGWNLLLTRENAKIYVKEGMKAQRGWSKFIYAKKNDEPSNYTPTLQSKSSYGSYGGNSTSSNRKPKFIEKSQKNNKIGSRNSSQKELEPKENKKETIAENYSQDSYPLSNDDYEWINQNQKKLDQRSKYKQRSEYQQKKPQVQKYQTKKKKYVAKTSFPVEGDIANFTKKESINVEEKSILKVSTSKEDDKKLDQAVQLPQQSKSTKSPISQQVDENGKGDKNPQIQQKHQQQLQEQSLTDEEEKLKKIKLSIQKKKSKTKNKDTNKKKGGDSNNPYNDLEIY